MKEKAQQIISLVEDACSEIGYINWEEFKLSGTCLGDKKLDDKIKEMKASGVQDIGGALADDFYNDPDFCEDMLGDRIHDEAEGEPKIIVALAESIKELSSNQAMKKACDNIIKRWKK